MKPFREAVGYDDDLQSAYDYYKTYSPAAAGRFVAAYEKAVDTLQYNPFICRSRKNGWRQMIIKGHPIFSVFYKEFQDFWLLAGIIPTVQDPDSIQARLLIREVHEGENG